MSKKICPLLAIGAVVSRADNEPCVGEKCAWWSEKFDECSIPSLFSLLHDLTTGGETSKGADVPALRVFAEKLTTED